MLQILLLGLDSLATGMILGPLLKTWRARAGLSIACGLCDGVASIAGGWLPHTVPQPSTLLLYGVVAAVVVLAARRSPGWLVAAPPILALDNLSTGAPLAAAAVLALSSAMMACAGLGISAVVDRGFRGVCHRAAVVR